MSGSRNGRAAKAKVPADREPGDRLPGLRLAARSRAFQIATTKQGGPAKRMTYPTPPAKAGGL